MTRNKNPNRINIRESRLEFESTGFEVREMNYYQFRISSPDMPGVYDWYHTSGTLVRNDPERGPASKGKRMYMNAKSVIKVILERDLNI